MKARVRVVGIGSPNGDDAIGMETVRQLQKEMGECAGVELCIADSGQRLLDHIDPSAKLILIDALAGENPGTIHRLTWPDQRIAALCPTSTHALGVPQALELAAAIGQLPQRVVIYAIEIDRAEPASGMSPFVGPALAELISLIQSEIVRGMG